MHLLLKLTSKCMKISIKNAKTLSNFYSNYTSVEGDEKKENAGQIYLFSKILDIKNRIKFVLLLFKNTLFLQLKMFLLSFENLINLNILF